MSFGDSGVAGWAKGVGFFVAHRHAIALDEIFGGAIGSSDVLCGGASGEWENEGEDGGAHGSLLFGGNGNDISQNRDSHVLRNRMGRYAKRVIRKSQPRLHSVD